MKAPAHLRPETRRWWRSVTRSWLLEAHHVRLLTAACEAWDRATAAREQVDAEGLTIPDRHGIPKAHPLLAVEKDNRALFARLLRELDLDVAAPAEGKRPPELLRYRGVS